MPIGFAVVVFVSVVVIPLLAFVVAHRLPPPRYRPVPVDALGQIARRHRLGSAEVIEVQNAVLLTVSGRAPPRYQQAARSAMTANAPAPAATDS